MVDYVCGNGKCRKVIKGILVERKIRCPYCGGKTLRKVQDRVLDVVKAR
jgi:DNA-directed RNA polymerase subunit RPC12/RpoP